MIFWFHDLTPTPSSPFNPYPAYASIFPFLLRRRLNCKYIYVLLLTSIYATHCTRFLSGNAATEGFSYYVLFP